MILLPFTLLFWVQVYIPFLCFLSREDPLAFIGELISRFWIIFTIIIWNCLSGRFLSLPLLFGLVGIYPVPLPAGYSSVSSSCLYCCIWGGLSVFWQFVEFSLSRSLLAVDGFVWVACQGVLVREACVGVLVGRAGFLPSGVQ